MTEITARARQRGFTLLELMIVVSILAIVASIGVPQYVSALRTARVGKAKHELVTISHAIDAYRATNGGQLPLTLHQVGFGGKSDPWGVPYCYLNYLDGTGDGLEWAIEVGLVDPSAIVASDSGSGGGSSGGALGGTGGLGGKRGGFAPATARRRVRPQDPIDEGLGGAIADTGARTKADAVVQTLSRDVAMTEFESLVSSIAENPGFSVYTGVPVESTRRRDRYMFPLNTDYDLFSLGPNARTSVSLGEAMAQDDVIRANNGGFFGLASDY